MDLQDFTAQNLYFDDTVNPEIAELLAEASLHPQINETEQLLLRAYFLNPNDLHVLVALYRYFYTQQQFKDAQTAALKAIEVSAKRLHLPENWRHLTRLHIGQGVLVSMTLTRFYLLAHKAVGLLDLQLNALDDALGRLQALAELDQHDRLGVRTLLKQAQDILQMERHALL